MKPPETEERPIQDEIRQMRLRINALEQTVRCLKETEKGLIESEQRAWQFYELAPMPYQSLDNSGRTLKVNRAWVASFGYPQEAVVGKPFEDFLHPDSVDVYRAGFRRLVSDGETHGAQLDVRKRDGAFASVIWDARAVYDDTRLTQAHCTLRNVTDQDRLIDALSNERSRLVAIFDALRDGLSIIDEDHRVVFANPVLEAVFGTWTGRKCYDYFFGRTEPCSQCRGTEVLNGETIRAERRFPARGRIFDVIEAPIKNADGRRGRLEVFRDITERDEINRALHESENLMSLVLGSTSELIAYQDRDMRVVWANRAAGESIGRKTEDLIGRRCHEIWNNRETPCEGCPVQQTFLSGKEHTAERVTPDGRAWMIRAAPVKDDHGGVIGAVEITLEITDWKKAEEALRSSEKRYRTLFENSPTALWEEDFSGVRQYVEDLKEAGIADFRTYFEEHPDDVLRCADMVGITEVNQAAMDLYGTRDLEEFARVSNRNVRGKTRQAFEGVLLAVAEGVRELGFEYATATARGEERFMQLTWSVAPGYEKSLSKVLVSVVDLTERKKAEDAVRRAELQLRRYSEELEQMVTDRTTRIMELERQRGESEKLAATGRMAARIAHEINNPLAGIKNSFLLVRDIMDKKHPHYAYADLIGKEIDRIAQIIRRMFDLYSPGWMKAVSQSIADAVQDVAGLLDSTCRAAGVELRVEIPSVPITVTTPSGYINQILFNLIQNAIEASKPGDVIRVRSEVKRDSIILSVHDQGRGISPEVSDQIFEPFFTTKTETSAPGLGLGLSVSKGMAEAMGGSITFRSQPSGGTVFTLTLRRAGLQKED